jgi:hypothetical protein
MTRPPEGAVDLGLSRGGSGAREKLLKAILQAQGGRIAQGGSGAASDQAMGGCPLAESGGIS